MSRNRQDDFFIATHTADVFKNNQLADRNYSTYFQDFTNNHNKALVEVEVQNADPGVSVTVVIETRGGRPIEKVLDLFSADILNRYEGQAAFQVENLRRVRLRGTSTDPTDEFDGKVKIQKTFCIDCPGDVGGQTSPAGNRKPCGCKNRGCNCVYRHFEDD